MCEFELDERGITSLFVKALRVKLRTGGGRETGSIYYLGGARNVSGLSSKTDPSSSEIVMSC